MSDVPAAAALPYWRLSGYYFFYFAFIGGFSPYFGLYLQERGFSAWHIALLLSQMQLMRLVAPMAWGWVADHSGRPVAIVRASAVLSLAGLSGFFFVDSFAGWLLAMAVMAFFWSAALPLVETLTLQHLAARHAAYTRVRLWGSVGFIVAVTGIGALLERLPLSDLPAMLFVLLAGLLAVALAFPADVRVAPAPAKGSLRGVLRGWRVRALLAGCFFMSVAHGTLYIFYSIYLADHGHSSVLIGALWSLGVIAEIGVFLFAGHWLQRFSPRVMLGVCLLAAAIRFTAIALGVGSVTVLVLSQLLHGLTFGAFHAVSIAAINRWFPAGCRGRGQALYSSVSFGAGGLVGGLLSGMLWDPLGGAWAFAVSALFALVGALLVFARVLQSGYRRRSRQGA